MYQLSRLSTWKQKTKKQLFDKYGNKCMLCFLPMLQPYYIRNVPKYDYNKYECNILATIDHIQERRNGGSNYFTNLRLTHAFCNSIREFYPDPRWHPQHETLVLRELFLQGILDS